MTERRGLLEARRGAGSGGVRAYKVEGGESVEPADANGDAWEEVAVQVERFETAELVAFAVRIGQHFFSTQVGEDFVAELLNLIVGRVKSDQIDRLAPCHGGRLHCRLVVHVHDLVGDSLET